MKRIVFFLYLFTFNVFLYSQSVISGLIVNIDGEPLIGVTIMVKESSQGTITDSDGRYSISVDGSYRTLVFSYIGYQTQEIEIGNKSVINVVLREKTQELEDVVIVGYGHQKKVSVTGAISTVPIKYLISVPVVTLDNALAGHLQGVVTKLTSGQPGTEATIRIRGIGTWTNANPLVLVDGIERSINLVNPQDVESISVLKDATATAVYGVRGAMELF